MRFLIVEDHVGMADQLSKGFRERGYNAKFVGDGEEGLFEATEIEYTLAVIDLGLPGMSGIDLIRQLRKAGNKVPIIVLTARNDVESIVQAMEAGADDYLKKPVYLEELFAHIDAVLRRVLGDPQLDNPVLEFGELQLDRRKRIVTRGADPIELTRSVSPWTVSGATGSENRTSITWSTGTWEAPSNGVPARTCGAASSRATSPRSTKPLSSMSSAPPSFPHAARTATRSWKPTMSSPSRSAGQLHCRRKAF